MQNVSVVRVVRDRLAWYAADAGGEPRWLDDDVTAQRLRATLSQRRQAVLFAAPAPDLRLLSLSVDAAEKKHVRKSLPFTLEDDVAADIDALHFAHCNIDRDTLGVAICSRERMEAWRERLADFPGINTWVPEPLLLPWQPGEWCLALEGDDAIVRTGPCAGFGIERDLAATLLEGSLRENEAPTAVVVYGGDEEADLALVPESLRPLAQWRRGGLSAALLLSDGNAAGLNLLQGEFAPRLPLERWWRQWRAVAVIFGAAFALQLAATYADYRNLRAQNTALRTAVQESYRRAYPQGQVVDPEMQLRRQIDALRGTASGGGFVGLVEHVGAAIAAMPDTSIATLNYNDRSNEMRMNILAADFEGVERLRSRINEAGLEAVMESSSAQGDVVRARLRVGKRS